MENGSAGHPEFSRDFMEDLISWRTESAPEALPQQQAQEAIALLDDQAVTAKDRAAWQHLCKTFLRS